MTRETFAYWTACIMFGLMLGIGVVIAPNAATIFALCLLGGSLAAAAIVLFIMEWVER